MTIKPSTVRELLIRPGRWIKTHLAQDRAGRPVPVDSASAVSWCLEGAIDFVYGAASDQAQEAKDKVLSWINSQEYRPPEEEEYAHEGKFGSLPAWNDQEGRTFKDIRKAINATEI